MTSILLIILIIYLPIPYFSVKFPFRVPVQRTGIHPLNKRSVVIKKLLVVFYKVLNSLNALNNLEAYYTILFPNYLHFFFMSVLQNWV